jgi:hypothetical protein
MPRSRRRRSRSRRRRGGQACANQKKAFDAALAALDACGKDASKDAQKVAKDVKQDCSKVKDELRTAMSKSHNKTLMKSHIRKACDALKDAKGCLKDTMTGFNGVEQDIKMIIDKMPSHGGIDCTGGGGRRRSRRRRRKSRKKRRKSRKKRRRRRR